MHEKVKQIALTIVLGISILTVQTFAQTKFPVPNVEFGDFELSTQALGYFGTVPHKSVKPGVPNYYAQFSLWAGAVTDKGDIRVSCGDPVKEDAPSEWMLVPLSWTEEVKPAVPSVKTQHSGQFTDTRSFEGHIPLGLVVTMTSYGFSKKGYALYEYAVTLKEGYSPLKALYVGFQADVDVPNSQGRLTARDDRLGLLSSGKGLYIYDRAEDRQSCPLLGFQVTGLENPTLSWWTSLTDPRTDEDRYELLKGNGRYPKNPEEKADYRFMASDGPYALNPGEVLYLTVAVVYARGEIAINAQAQAADQFFIHHLKKQRLAKGALQEAKKELADLSIPGCFALYPAFPNPFNSQTQIVFDLPESQDVYVTIYNLLGQSVKSLFQGKKDAGTHTLRWDGTDSRGHNVGSGLYLVILKAGQHKFQQKLVLMK